MFLFVWKQQYLFKPVADKSVVCLKMQDKIMI